MMAFGWVDNSRCSTDAFVLDLSKEERMMMFFVSRKDYGGAFGVD